jgi:hypothetical protein
LEVHAKQAQNVEAERRACEIRLRAERKAGQLLQDAEKNKGGNPNLSRGGTGCEPSVPTLPSLGISRNQSSRWQQLAKVPDGRAVRCGRYTMCAPCRNGT